MRQRDARRHEELFRIERPRPPRRAGRPRWHRTHEPGAFERRHGLQEHGRTVLPGEQERGPREHFLRPRPIPGPPLAPERRRAVPARRRRRPRRGRPVSRTAARSPAAGVAGSATTVRRPSGRSAHAAGSRSRRAPASAGGCRAGAPAPCLPGSPADCRTLRGDGDAPRWRRFRAGPGPPRRRRCVSVRACVRWWSDSPVPRASPSAAARRPDLRDRTAAAAVRPAGG